MTRRSILQVIGGLIGGVAIGRSAPIGPFNTQSGLGTEKNPYEDKLAHGPLDDINSNRLWARQQVATTMRLAFPGYSTCMRCEFPWAIVGERSVWIKGGSGIFALCVECWDELQVAELRKPYYRKLVEQQHGHWQGYTDKYPKAADPLLNWPQYEASIEKDSAAEREAAAQQWSNLGQ